MKLSRFMFNVFYFLEKREVKVCMVISYYREWERVLISIDV